MYGLEEEKVREIFHKIVILKAKKNLTADSKNFDLDKFQYARSVEQNMNMKIVNNKFYHKNFKENV